MNRLLTDEVLTPAWFFDKPEINAFSTFDKGYLNRVIVEADEIISGQIRLFGADPAPLDFSLPSAITHWTLHETGEFRQPVEDIKFLWEPARFGWAITLGKAYHFTKQKQYSEQFWLYLDKFTHHNPLKLWSKLAIRPGSRITPDRAGYLIEFVKAIL